MAEMKVANLSLLLRCYEGLRNWRALTLLVGGFVIAALLMALDGVVGVNLASSSQTMAMLLGGLLALIAVLVLLAGINGAGLLLVDQADGRPPRSMSAAFFGGIGVTLQTIVCLIILGIGLLVVILVLWALSFLGKIPGLGPFFAFLLAGPSMLVLAFCYAVLTFGVALMLVALWRGHGMIGSIGRAIDIVTKRPLDTVLHFIVLALLIVPIELFVAAVMFGGSALTTMMYVSSSFSGYGALSLSDLLSSFSGGSMGGAAISIGVVVAAIFALFVLIQMLGSILIFDSLSAETDVTSTDFLRKAAGQVKAKIEEHRPQAPAASRMATPPPSAQRSVPPPSSAATCANCGSLLTPGDRFCGECGTPAT